MATHDKSGILVQASYLCHREAERLRVAVHGRILGFPPIGSKLWEKLELAGRAMASTSFFQWDPLWEAVKVAFWYLFFGETAVNSLSLLSTGLLRISIFDGRERIVIYIYIKTYKKQRRIIFLCDKPPYCILAPKCPHCHKKENTVCMCVMCVLAYNRNIWWKVNSQAIRFTCRITSSVGDNRCHESCTAFS